MKSHPLIHSVSLPTAHFFTQLTSVGNEQSNKSSLLGQHPHDTVPVYTSDLFPRTSRQTRQRQRAVQVVGAAELVEGLDYGEI